MIVEKPKCPYCNCSTDNSDIIYLKKTEDGWSCPNCGREFYEKQEHSRIPFQDYPNFTGTYGHPFLTPVWKNW